LLNKVKLKNFGPISDLAWKGLSSLNLVIGDNGSGKTFLLKALYSAMRTAEVYKRGDEPRNAADILLDKLHWTFQAEKIGDLVAKGAEGPLRFSVDFDGRGFAYSFGKDTVKQITTVENQISPRASDSVFFPAKEVVSIQDIILESRERGAKFGFDDTYLDLARALRRSPGNGENPGGFASARRGLESTLGGRLEYDDKAQKWQFRKGNQRFPMGVTAEGIKKIAILDSLLANHYLDEGSIVFFDEPEAALHPVAISKLLDITADLAEMGIQFFFASHSYFVVKKLYLIAQTKGASVPALSLHAQGYDCTDLKDGMPDNPIIDESIRLYQEEVELALQ
jgi:energy-coupling factor transporter ATP-binding protein EcfA2